MTHAEGSAHGRSTVNGPDCWGLSDDDDDEDEDTRKPLPGQSSTALTQPHAPRPGPVHPRMPDLQLDGQPGPHFRIW